LYLADCGASLGADKAVQEHRLRCKSIPRCYRDDAAEMILDKTAELGRSSLPVRRYSHMWSALWKICS
jgi:hypothetical protein